MNKLPLKNTETKKIPIGPRLQKEIKAQSKSKTKAIHPNEVKPKSSHPNEVKPKSSHPNEVKPKSSHAKDVKPKTSHPKEKNDTQNKLLGNGCSEKPTLFTTEKLLKSLQDIKNLEPNITQMVDDKLASPTTAKYVRKKKASKTTVLESKRVYQDLVALDISGTNLFKGIEEDLQRRACAVQPKSRPPDPEPCLEDYFKEEEFVNVRTVGPSDIFPLAPTRKPFTSTNEILNQYIDLLLC